MSEAGDDPKLDRRTRAWSLWALVLGYNELVKQSESLGERAYFRLGRDQAVQELQALGVEVNMTYDGPVLLSLGEGRPHIEFREGDIQAMRETVAKWDRDHPVTFTVDRSMEVPCTPEYRVPPGAAYRYGIRHWWESGHRTTSWVSPENFFTSWCTECPAMWTGDTKDPVLPEPSPGGWAESAVGTPVPVGLRYAWTGGMEDEHHIVIAVVISSYGPNFEWRTTTGDNGTFTEKELRAVLASGKAVLVLEPVKRP